MLLPMRLCLVLPGMSVPGVRILVPALVPALFFSAVQINNGSFCTYRAPYVPRITASGRVSLCRYIDHLPCGLVGRGSWYASWCEKTETDSPRARARPQSYACRQACLPVRHDCGLPCLAYRVRLRVRLRACPCASPVPVPARARQRAYGGERVREVGLLPSRMLPKFDFEY